MRALVKLMLAWMPAESAEPWSRVPIERYGRPWPYEGAHAVGRMSASEPFDGTRDQGGDNYYVENY